MNISNIIYRLNFGFAFVMSEFYDSANPSFIQNSQIDSNLILSNEEFNKCL